jgi:hypothetical protein
MTVNSSGTLHNHVKSNSLRWDEELVGTVTSSNSWPFTAGSGLNAKYNGDQVFQLVENEDQSQCAGISYWIGQEATARQGDMNLVGGRGRGVSGGASSSSGVSGSGGAGASSGIGASGGGRGGAAEPD